MTNLLFSHEQLLHQRFLQTDLGQLYLAGMDTHYSNEYKLTDDASKLTPGMADFLKI